MPKSPHLTPSGLQENLQLYFTGHFPSVQQIVHLYTQRGWWDASHDAQIVARDHHRQILELIRGIRDDEGYRTVYIIGAKGRERVVQEELFEPKEYFLAIADYYRARRDDTRAVEKLKKDCYFRYGIEVPPYEDWLEDPDHPQWQDEQA